MEGADSKDAPAILLELPADDRPQSASCVRPSASVTIAVAHRHQRIPQSRRDRPQTPMPHTRASSASSTHVVRLHRPIVPEGLPDRHSR